MNKFNYYGEIYKHTVTRNLHTYTEKIIREKGDIYLMCPKCFNMTKVKLIETNKRMFIMGKIESFHTENNYYGQCPNCNEDVKFEIIDANIGETINILNTKGYYTAFCCEGHIELEHNDYKPTEEFTNAYIYFYFWEDTEILKTHPLPSTWFIDEQDKKCKIFVIRDNIIKEIPEDNITDNKKYIDWIYNNWHKKNRLKDIYDWAVSLPEKGSTTKEYERYAIEEFGSDILLKNTEKLINLLNQDEK